MVNDAGREIERNLRAVRERVTLAAERSGRKPEEILLMGVSKFQPLELIYAARDAGLTLFGENRVQERGEKLASWEGPSAECHMIGHLQRNKARRAVELFDCVQSVDSVNLALAVERMITENENIGADSEDSARFQNPYKIMVEVNVSGEISKQGVTPGKSFAIIEDIAVKCPHVEIAGLMTIGPLTGGEGAAGDAFASLRKLRDQARERFGLPLRHLSMGMSGDYEIAIREGSTIVRVGTAIFGARKI